ncbi:SDR family NAD(P)-dependent oxidoreductase [Pedobacter sp. L105]|uniref:SDR family NAD(P)-dependent oxidoreductase n=1 Tax=Pedobacter sp. L105 TaxID=1641871 RepID=UPI00131AC006|nr:SDR family NAD(P)-dependent oxidoreductase [Pedobacter sp. L105]
MKRSKVWVVLGAAEGLGYAAVKYLTANRQTVIAVADTCNAIFFDCCSEHLYLIHPDISDKVELTAAFKTAGINYGSIDYIINNGNYRLFHNAQLKTDQEVEKTIQSGAISTIDLITGMLPYLRKKPQGNIINIPPQLCLASVPDPLIALNLAAAMELFLKRLHQGLQTLDCGLKFLEPGERLTGFKV